MRYKNHKFFLIFFGSSLFGIGTIQFFNFKLLPILVSDNKYN